MTAWWTGAGAGSVALFVLLGASAPALAAVRAAVEAAPHPPGGPVLLAVGAGLAGLAVVVLALVLVVGAARAAVGAARRRRST